MLSTGEGTSLGFSSLDELLLAMAALCGVTNPSAMRHPDTNLELSARATTEHLALN